MRLPHDRMRHAPFFVFSIFGKCYRGICGYIILRDFFQKHKIKNFDTVMIEAYDFYYSLNIFSQDN